MTSNNKLHQDEELNNSGTENSQEYLNELKSKVSAAIDIVINSLHNGAQLDNETLVQFVNFMIMQDGWEIKPSTTPNSKGRLLEHREYGKFATGMIDDNGFIILDETGVPDSFTMMLKGGGNLVRLKGGNIRFTGKIGK